VNGWIKVGGTPVEFGFGVPVPADLDVTNRAVKFDVTPITMAGQREPFDRHALIGRKATHWYSAHPGEEYEVIGIYVGGGMVLTADVPGGI